MAIEIIPAEELPLKEQAALFTEAFAGFVGGSFAMDAAGLARFLCAQGADLCHSRFARNGGSFSGFAYVNHTAGVTRVAGMGVPARARRAGVARQLLEHVIMEARDRGDTAVVLEVIEQNPAAHALYRRGGFREIDRLLGWRRMADTEVEEAAAPREISFLAACHAPNACEFPALPWVVSRHAVAKVFSARAFSTGNATVVITGAESDGPIRVHALFLATTEAEEWEALGCLLRKVLGLFPGREFFALPVFPEKFGEEIFAPLDFAREKISQFHMRYDLAPVLA